MTKAQEDRGANQSADLATGPPNAEDPNAADISERARLEGLLRDSEELLRESQREAQLGHYEFDIRDDRWVPSEALSRIFGIDESYVCDFDGWVNVVHPADREAMRRYVTEEVVGKGAPFDRDYRIQRISDGTERWVHGRGRLKLDDAGEPCSLFGVIQDITERKRYQVELLETNARLEGMVRDVVEALGRAVEMRDPFTRGHQDRVARIAKAVAIEMGLSESVATCVEMTAIVHDIGKLAVPTEILTKPGTLSENEFELIKGHPARSHEILAPIAFPWPVAEIALQHHERMDGSGYPRGLIGDEIMLEARILAVADEVEAMASHRPYRPALELKEAISEVSCSDREKYDPAVTDAIVRLFDAGKLEL